MSLVNFTKHVAKVEAFTKLSKYLSLNKDFTRCYTIQPPEWLGGKSMFDFSGQYDFPEHSKSFEERIKEIEEARLAKKAKKEGKNIGQKIEKNTKDEETLQSIIKANKKNFDLERASRFKKLLVPLDEVRQEWWEESGATHVHHIACHYGIFEHIFNNDYFYPTLNMKVNYDYDDDLVTPVYYGNIIPACDTRNQPNIAYKGESNGLYTLLMVNPDECLTDQNCEYLHWSICNIPGDDISEGDVLAEYMPPIPAAGTGFHRNVLILLKQKARLTDLPTTIPAPTPDKGYVNLQLRHFSTNDFLKKQSQLLPVALSFFQTQWDETVRRYFREVLGIGEPVFEYDWPVAYHPPPKKYPHKEPFNLYFDRYRDKKDIGEEVIRIKMKEINPFKAVPDQVLQYPLAHKPLHRKPSWLKQKEELIARRVEQYADID